jgi:hypothetical protein
MRQDQQDLTCKTRPAGSDKQSKIRQKMTSMQNKTSRIQHVKTGPAGSNKQKKLEDSAMQNMTSRIPTCKTRPAVSDMQNRGTE